MDLSKRVNMCMLMDFYGNMLTQKQQNIMHKYYEQDSSLAEIGHEEGISRQAVRDAIVVSENVLCDIEAKLGFVSKHNELKQSANEIIDIVNSDADKKIVVEKLNLLLKDL